MHNYPLFASKQTSARIDFLRQGERLVDRMASFYVKFLAESWTIGDWATYASLCNGTENHVRLQPPARAVVGHAAYDQRRRYHGNAEGILTLTAGFQLVGHVLNDCHRVTFSGLTTFYHRQMGAEFHILSYLCSVLRSWAGCLSWFYGTKIKNASQFIEILNFRKWINHPVIYSLMKV